MRNRAYRRHKIDKFRTCCIEGCGKRMNARGLCMMHYAQWMKGKDLPIQERIRRPNGPLTWDWIEKNSIPIPFSGCLIWLGALDQHGYACVNNGKGTNKGPGRVHRVAYEMFKGKLKKGFDLDHLCRVPSCINPEHLEQVTRKENVRRGAGNGGILKIKNKGGSNAQ